MDDRLLSAGSDVAGLQRGLAVGWAMKTNSLVVFWVLFQRLNYVPTSHHYFFWFSHLQQSNTFPSQNEAPRLGRLSSQPPELSQLSKAKIRGWSLWLQLLLPIVTFFLLGRSSFRWFRRSFNGNPEAEENVLNTMRR